MTRFAALVLTLSAGLNSAAAPAHAEDILSTLARKAEMPAQPAPSTVPYTYTLSIDMQTVEGKDISENQALLRVDPNQPAGARVQILSATDTEEDALNDFIKDIEDPDNNMAENFWCGAFDGAQGVKADGAPNFNPSDFEVLSETPTEATLRPREGTLAELLMQSDDNADKNGRKMKKKLMERIDGQMTLSKPDAQMKGFRVTMTRPLKMMLVAKLKAMNVEQSCTLAPNGFYHMSRMKLHVDGKAMGSRFGQTLNIELSDLTPI